MRLRAVFSLVVVACPWAQSFAHGKQSSVGDITAPSSGDIPHDARYENVMLDDQKIIDPLHITGMPRQEEADSPRHQEEKAQLMKRMSRHHGTWNTAHPRYRLLEALYGFSKYRERNLAELKRWRDLYKNVGPKQKEVLEKAVAYTKKLYNIEEAFYENEILCKSIIENALAFYHVDRKELQDHVAEAEKAGRTADRISTSQTLKHFVRDWADEGAQERNEAFPCLLDTLSSLKYRQRDRKALEVLLPGSGLGRLGHEIANLTGFAVTINEWSMYMNIGYRFITQQHDTQKSAVYPFADGMSHHATTANMLRKINIPNAHSNPSVLLVEGDFNTAFQTHDSHFDIIVTHFFIDTARNLMSYFDTIHKLLKPGGKWINFGPLLYGTGPFVQLSLDEIIKVVEEMGFVFEDLGDECGELTFEGGKVRSKEAEYGFDGRALTRNAYLAQVWVAKKL